MVGTWPSGLAQDQAKGRTHKVKPHYTGAPVKLDEGKTVEIDLSFDDSGKMP